MNLPYRYDELALNNDIWMVNELIKKITNGVSNVVYNEVHLQRHLYTKHGLHFSRGGKLKYAEELVSMLCVGGTKVPYLTDGEAIAHDILRDLVIMAVGSDLSVVSDRGAVVDAGDSVDDNPEDLEAVVEAIERDLDEIGWEYLRALKSHITGTTSLDSRAFHADASTLVGSPIPVIMGHGQSSVQFFRKSHTRRKRWKFQSSTAAVREGHSKEKTRH